MKKYKLKLENSLGNCEVATFYNAAALKEYVNNNPPSQKYHYYVVVEEIIRTRVNDISKVK